MPAHDRGQHSTAVRLASIDCRHNVIDVVAMAEVVLYHHALGLTSGVVALAEELRGAGHTVHTPDLYEGRTFGTVDEGVAHAREIGFGEVIERGVRAAEALPDGLVYAGISLGVLPTQMLA